MTSTIRFTVAVLTATLSFGLAPVMAADGQPAGPVFQPVDRPQSQPVSPPAPQEPAISSPQPPNIDPPTNNETPAPSASPLSALSNLPGLGQYIRPDGFVLPNGAGSIQRTPDHIGVQLNTPDGPFQITIPRRQGDDAAGPRARRRNGASREFAASARLFATGNYAATLRRINRALQRNAGDHDLLQLRALVQFAMADYAAAYTDAVTVLGEGEIWDWPTLRSFYRSSGEYTAQYRALEARTVAAPNAIEPRFVLAYHNLMLGNTDAARRQFGSVAALDPGNEAARHLAAGLPPVGPGAEGPPVPFVTVPQRKPGSPAPIAPATSSPQSPSTPRVSPQRPSSSEPFRIDLGKPGTLDAPAGPTPAK